MNSENQRYRAGDYGDCPGSVNAPALLSASVTPFLPVNSARRRGCLSVEAFGRAGCHRRTGRAASSRPSRCRTAGRTCRGRGAASPAGRNESQSRPLSCPGKRGAPDRWQAIQHGRRPMVLWVPTQHAWGCALPSCPIGGGCTRRASRHRSTARRAAQVVIGATESAHINGPRPSEAALRLRGRHRGT